MLIAGGAPPPPPHKMFGALELTEDQKNLYSNRLSKDDLKRTSDFHVFIDVENTSSDIGVLFKYHTMKWKIKFDLQQLCRDNRVRVAHMTIIGNRNIFLGEFKQRKPPYVTMTDVFPRETNCGVCNTRFREANFTLRPHNLTKGKPT